jgi:hypothetical protein
VDNSFNQSPFSNEVSAIPTGISPVTFTDISASITGVSNSSVAWGDYDNDGDLDILLTGSSGTGSVSKIYRNDSSGKFVDISASLSAVDLGSVSWGDYDNDGDLDILLTGFFISKIYRNDNNNFVDISAGLTGVDYSSASWGDYDDDGDLDVLLTGIEISNTRISKLYRNDSGNFIEISAGLIGVNKGSVAFGDYDNDSDLDILLTGYTGSSQVSKIYRNDNGKFAEISPGFIGVEQSSSAFGDYDNDGDLDILLAGLSGTNYTSKVYRNDSGIFKDVFTPFAIITTLTGNSSVAWGDYDNDGDLDILLTGVGENTQIYRNDNGSFTGASISLAKVYSSSTTFGDYDNDGDLDILLTGISSSTNISKIYRNDGTIANILPSAPTNLTSIPKGRNVTLSWNRATDNQTSKKSLTYNLRIGATPNGIQKISPMANVSTGYRRIPKLGNTNHDTSWTIKNLSPGKYYWSVQTIDNAFAGSTFAIEKSFDIINNPPKVVSKIPDVSYPEDSGEHIVVQDLNTVFKDTVDNDALTFTAKSDNNNVSVSVQGLLNISGIIDREVVTSKSRLDFNNQPNNKIIPEVTPNDIKITSLNNNEVSSSVYNRIKLVDSADNDVLTSNDLKNENSESQGAIKLVVTSAKDYFGSARILVTASDGVSSVSDTFIVTITPINDPPPAFNLISPKDSSRVDSLKIKFVWNKSKDPDSNRLIYRLILFSSATLVDTSVVDTTFMFNGKGKLRDDSTYSWYVMANDGEFITQSADTFIFKTPRKTDVKEKNIQIPKVYTLHQNYPNPFNPITTIQYELPYNSDVSIKIYDIIGREVITLVNGKVGAGYQKVVWNGRNGYGREVSSGVYFYKIIAVEMNRSSSHKEKFVKVKKLLLIK